MMAPAHSLDHQDHRKSSPQHRIVTGKTRFRLFFNRDPYYANCHFWQGKKVMFMVTYCNTPRSVMLLELVLDVLCVFS